MIITREIERIETDMNGLNEYLRITYTLNLQLEDKLGDDLRYNKKVLNIDYNPKGEIINFPSLGGTSCEEPMYYVLIGKAIESIINTSCSEISKLCNDAIDLYFSAKKRMDEIRNSKEYRELYSLILSSDKEISELRSKMSRARKEETIASYQENITKLETVSKETKESKKVYDYQTRSIDKEYFLKLKELRENTRVETVL